MTRHCFLRLILAALFAVSATALPAAEPVFRAGCQTYTFRSYTVYEAIEKTAEAGGTVVEFFGRQKLSAADPAVVRPDLNDEQVAALLEHLKKNRVKAASLSTNIPKDEAEARKLFAFAKRLGLEALTTESVGSIDTIEKMVKEFDVRVGFHQHMKKPDDDSYKLWDPQFVLDLVKNRDPRIGACADTGHWASSGLVPLDAIKLLAGRIINLHLKDRELIGRLTTDQILGTGILDIAGILQELQRQKFSGCIFVEYEANWSKSVPDVRQCLDFIRNPVIEPAGAAAPVAPEASLTAEPQSLAFTLSEPGLKAVIVDSDERESFLGLQLDSAGRLFAGCREALFVYEPAAGGLYQPRQLLFRFPKHAWVYDIAIRGDDLYVSTHTAIYLLEGAVKKREGIASKRLVWGLPMMKGYEMHQGIHDLEIGPEGDLYFSNGDESIRYGTLKRPDHWSHWTYFHGIKGTRVTGGGGVFRISPDGEKFEVIAAGTRNNCGISFDRAWNLFASDNDHESMPSEYVPGRLLHITPGAYFSWPRGWMPEKDPWRADLLDTLNPNVGRYVPTGQIYYDDTFLPESCRHSLYVAEWGRGKLLRYPLRAQGASFKAEQIDFLGCPPDVSPVGLAIGRGGRIFTSVCYMKGNEASPMYRSEIVMITRDDDTAAAPFEAYEETSAPLQKLYAELESASWQRRYRAHVELLRRGAAACEEAAARLEKASAGSPLHTHLLWLAAASGAMEKIVPLTTSTAPETRHQALRALVKFAPKLAPSILDKALNDPNPQVVHIALTALRDRFDSAPIPRVLALARSSERLLRQAAVQLLAARIALPDLQKLCESTDAADRLTGILIAGQLLTIPPLSGPLPDDWPLDPMQSTVSYVGEKVDLSTRGPVGNFTLADAWAKRAKSPDDESLFALLERRLHDPVGDNAKQAAFFLRLLKDSRTDAQCSALLGLPADKATQGTPLQGATSTGITELPTAFKAVDWSKEGMTGDPKKGAALYSGRGCAVCHVAKAGDTGGGGPSLAGAGSRFNIPYLVEAVITPNKVVSPIFKWTLLTKKDGTATAGLITSESGAELEVLLPSGISQTLKKGEIAKREMQDRSPMPEGLIQNPDELRDILAFLMSLKEEK